MVWKDGVPHVSFGARDLANDDVKSKLTRGTRQLIALRLYAYSSKSDRPIALTQVSCEVAYDVWEETFRVQRIVGTTERTERLPSLDAVLNRCLSVENLAVGTAARWASLHGASIYFAAVLEFNPVSRETIQRIRRWLARPDGTRTDNEAFFGSFVSVFINRGIGEAQRTLRIRSQTVEVPP